MSGFKMHIHVSGTEFKGKDESAGTRLRTITLVQANLKYEKKISTVTQLVPSGLSKRKPRPTSKELENSF